MRVFVTGVKGQLGHDVMNELAKRGHEGIGVDIEEMDITDAESVRKVITEANPDVVIHCAAWTAVDLAEDDDKKEKAFPKSDGACRCRCTRCITCRLWFFRWGDNTALFLAAGNGEPGGHRNTDFCREVCGRDFRAERWKDENSGLRKLNAWRRPRSA